MTKEDQKRFFFEILLIILYSFYSFQIIYKFFQEISNANYRIKNEIKQPKNNFLRKPTRVIEGKKNIEFQEKFNNCLKILFLGIKNFLSEFWNISEILNLFFGIFITKTWININFSSLYSQLNKINFSAEFENNNNEKINRLNQLLEENSIYFQNYSLYVSLFSFFQILKVKLIKYFF